MEGNCFVGENGSKGKSGKSGKNGKQGENGEGENGEGNSNSKGSNSGEGKQDKNGKGKNDQGDKNGEGKEGKFGDTGFGENNTGELFKIYQQQQLLRKALDERLEKEGLKECFFITEQYLVLCASKGMLFNASKFHFWVKI